MSAQTEKKPGKVTCAPRHELEKLACEHVGVLLHVSTTTNTGTAPKNWPFERLPVEVVFVERHAILFQVETGKVERKDGRAAGPSRILLNYGYLVQSHKEFLTHVVPSAVAQLVAELAAIAREKKVGVDDWVRWYVLLEKRDPLDDTSLLNLFDATAQQVRAGHVPAACNCQPPDDLRLIPKEDVPRMIEGAMTCERCRRPFSGVSTERFRPEVMEEIEFLAQEATIRSTVAKQDAAGRKRAPAKDKTV